MTTATATPPAPRSGPTAADVARRGTAARSARIALDDTIRAAAAAGVSDADIVRASGLAKDTVRRILGKIETKTAGRIRP